MRGQPESAADTLEFRISQKSGTGMISETTSYIHERTTSGRRQQSIKIHDP